MGNKKTKGGLDFSNMFEWSYSETEGSTSTRYDWESPDGEEVSMWVYGSYKDITSIEGHAPFELKNKIIENAKNENYDISSLKFLN